MKNSHRIASVALLSLAFVSRPEIAGSALAPVCPNPLPHEPLVLYEVNGGTLAGSVDYALDVFGDGTARLSSALGDGTGSSQRVVVPAADVGELHAGLLALGAMTECDQPDFVSDMPLSTLTVLRTGTRPRSNTFSWLDGQGDVAAMQALLEEFIAEHFAPPPGGGGDS